MESTKTSGIRVRFAPSPTGHLHIGNLRAAIFNWLYAKHNHGSFLLRIEDTDLVRSKQEYADGIIDILSWMGIESDEPVVYQSQRTDVYQKHLDRLIELGHAYWSNPAEEDNGKSVVRFRVPRDGKTSSVSFKDTIRGKITVDFDQIDDFVIARSDGSPLYNFVVVVDDALMCITHVIRGEDHISNTARQVLMYHALGYSEPYFAHLPLILGKTGAPLSKRDAVTSVEKYRTNGYLASALCNYLVRLGWAYGNQEIFTQDELIQYFSLDDVSKSGATFDPDKLQWINGVHIRQQSAEKLSVLMKRDIDFDIFSVCPSWSQEQIFALLDLYKERAVTLCDLAEQLSRLHLDPDYSTISEDVDWDMHTHELLDSVIIQLQNNCEDVAVDMVKSIVKGICKEQGVKLPALAKPLRFALTGKMESPAIFALMHILGSEVCIQRIKVLQKVLKG